MPARPKVQKNDVQINEVGTNERCIEPPKKCNRWRAKNVTVGAPWPRPVLSWLSRPLRAIAAVWAVPQQAIFPGSPEPTVRGPLLFVLMRERCGLTGLNLKRCWHVC